MSDEVKPNVRWNYNDDVWEIETSVGSGEYKTHTKKNKAKSINTNDFIVRWGKAKSISDVARYLCWSKAKVKGLRS